MVGRRVRRQASSEISTAGRLLVVILLGILGFRLHELVPSIARVTKPVMVIGPIALITIAMQSRRKIGAAFQSDRPLQFAAGLVGWGALLIPIALVRSEAFNTVQATLPLIALVVVFALLPANDRMLDQLLSYFAICGVALGTAALLLGKEMAEGRVSVTESLDPNDLAAALSVSMMFALGLALRRKGVGRLGYVLASSVLMLAILKTGSRGGVLGVAAGLIALVVASPARLIVRRAFLLGILCLIAWWQAPASLRDRMKSLTSLENDYNTQVYGGRQQIWQRGIQFGLSNPVAGVGMGNFVSADGAQMRESGIRGKWSAAHNSFVQAFAELGFPGLILFLLLSLEMLKIAFRSTRDRWLLPRSVPRPELFAATTGYLVSAFFLSAAYSWATFSLVAIINFAGLCLVNPGRESRYQT